MFYTTIILLIFLFSFVIFLILCSNTIYSLIFMIFIVLCVSGLLISVLKLEFFAVIFILIYVGVILVFFIFTVMILNLRFDFQNDIILVDFFLSLVGIFSLNLFIDYFITHDFSFDKMELLELYVPLEQVASPQTIPFFSNEYQLFFFNMKYFGFLLYTKFGFYIILVSLILLISLIGSIQIIKVINKG